MFLEFQILTDFETLLLSGTDQLTISKLVIRNDVGSKRRSNGISDSFS